MHPNTYHASLFNKPRRDEVFVVMSFSPEFEDTWTHIIEPAIREDVKLKPNRVDYNTSGESIIHDILDGIAHSRLILGDISCSLMRDLKGALWPQRNSNVMWEIGIAHVTRVPDEVILIRADDEPSIFDLTQFRAFPYNPSKRVESRALVARLCNDRLKSIDQFRKDYIERYARQMDHASWEILLAAWLADGYKMTHVIAIHRAGVLVPLTRLLDIGALVADYGQMTTEMIQAEKYWPFAEVVRYTLTPLGKALLDSIHESTTPPDIIQLLQQQVDNRKRSGPSSSA